MQFEGLQGLLRKKKMAATAVAAAATATATSPPPEAFNTEKESATAALNPDPSTTPNQNTLNATSTEDPYAAALLKAQTLQQQQGLKDTSGSTSVGRKRSREPSVSPDDAQQPDCGAVNAEAETTQETASLLQHDAQELKSPEEVSQQQRHGLEALQRCLTQLEQYWAASSPTSTASKSGVQAASSFQTSPPLPEALGTYLLTNFVSSNRRTPATGEREMTQIAREFDFLLNLDMEVENAASLPSADRATPSTNATDEGEESKNAEKRLSPPTAAHSAERERLGDLVRVLWYLVALRWQYSLHPNPSMVLNTPTKQRSSSTDSSMTNTNAQSILPLEQRGWSPYVYLALHNALPADVCLTAGRAVAEEVDRWRASLRTRQFALELLAYLHHDYLRFADAAATSDAASCIVPSSLRDSLYTMLVLHLQKEGQYMVVRQDYVDITMGTANWKLGLFSGGEVHMRRSMERVERNRIDHLLNNEHATHLLQSVREAATFVEQLKLPPTAPFFVAARGSSAGDSIGTR